MTDKEAIATLQTMEYELSNQVGSKYCRKKYEAVKTAINALEQEPCEDAVGRKAVFGLVKQMYLEVANSTVDSHTISDCISLTASKCREYIDEHIRELPPVTPTRKKGKWICVHHIENKITYDSWKCSECQHDFNTEEESMVDFDEYKYCPNCGTEMKGAEHGSN